MNLGAPCVGVTRGSSLFCWGAAISAVFYFAEGAVVEFSFYGIQTIELKFTIDKYTRSMVPLRVLSRTNLAGCPPSISCTSSISFASFRLRTLDFSLRSFSHLDPLFSITSALFSQNTGGCGYPSTSAPRIASAVTCATWRLYPLCPHSIAYTSRHHGGVPPTSGFLCSVSLCLCGNRFCSPFVFILLRIAFPATPFLSHPYKSPGGVCPPTSGFSVSTSWPFDLPTFTRSDLPTSGTVLAISRRARRVGEPWCMA